MWFIFNIGHEAGRMVFPARAETNQGSSIILPAYWLERVSRPYHREGTAKQ